jgi:hypothetical protein
VTSKTGNSASLNSRGSRAEQQVGASTNINATDLVCYRNLAVKKHKFSRVVSARFCRFCFRRAYDSRLRHQHRNTFIGARARLLLVFTMRFFDAIAIAYACARPFLLAITRRTSTLEMPERRMIDS